MKSIFEHINPSNTNKSLCVEGVYYTYYTLYEEASKIYRVINDKFSDEKVLGISLFNDFSTYASVIAAWAAGKGVVFLEPENTLEKNSILIQKTQCRVLLNSSFILENTIDFSDQLDQVNTFEFSNDESSLMDFRLDLQKPAYFFYIEKDSDIGEIIQYRWKDVEVAMKGIQELNLLLNSSDKFLSFFNFSHGLSVFTFLLALKCGGCFYSTPTKVNRAFITYSMVDEYQITFSFTTPWAVKQLEPFFDDIVLWSLKYLFIVGDTLHEKFISSLPKCAPNAYVFNAFFIPDVFGLISAVEIEGNEKHVVYNQLLTWGKAFNGFKVWTINMFGDELRKGEIGNLIIENRNVLHSSSFNSDNDLLDDTSDSFIDVNSIYNTYKSKYIGFVNDQGFLIPITSVYQQIIVDGIPVDLCLLEKQTQSIVNHRDVVAINYKNMVGYDEIHLFVQNLSLDSNSLFQELKLKLPEYMLPEQIHNVQSIPVDHDCFISYGDMMKILKTNETSFGRI